MTKEQIGGVFVLFGGTGDLAESEIFPAFHQLFEQGTFSEKFALIGVSRKDMSNEEYRDYVKEQVKQEGDNESIDEDFLKHFFYQSVDNTELDDFDKLSETIKEATDAFDAEPAYVYYYSIPPSLYDETTTNLKESGILDVEGSHRVGVEKPFGESLESAKEYYDIFKKAFDPEEIYLVDHFLGMQSIQNMLSTRYYNPFIEGVWNSEYIDHVQISLPEDFSIGDRGSFYDENGALLDMFQNHMLQILSFVAMDLPDELDEKHINEKKLELLKTIPSFTKEDVKEKVVRGQYDAYRDEEDVPEDSHTDSYIAIELGIDTDRWQGVPFYVRTGKSLAENHFTVDLIFKGSSDVPTSEQSRMTFSIEPQLGLSFVVHQNSSSESENGLKTILGPDKQAFEDVSIPEPYEVVLSDILKGSKRHIGTYDQVKEQWRITDSIKQAWDDLPKPSFPNYDTGDRGPKEAEDLLAKNNREWIYRD